MTDVRDTQDLIIGVIQKSAPALLDTQDFIIVAQRRGVSGCVVDYGTMRSDLANRLADPNLLFWTTNELKLYLIEALRTWNALTEIWITSFALTQNPAPTWYDISKLAGSPRLRTVLDTDLYTIMQYHLLEPATGGTWTGTSQFTLADLQGALKWGALADLLSGESEKTDRLRADYCFKRYLDGIKIMQASNWLVSATIGGKPVDTPSVVEMDRFANEWQNDSTVWPAVVTAGMDFVAPTPVGTSANVVLQVIGNAPLPTLDADCVSVLRDHYYTALDYAQVLASFKMGGAEFAQTQNLEKEFFLSAQDENKRFRSLGLYSDVLQREGPRPVINQPRRYDSVSTAR